MNTKTSPGRLAYLSKLTDGELQAQIQANETMIARYGTDEDRERADVDRSELLAEIGRRPGFTDR